MKHLFFKFILLFPFLVFAQQGVIKTDSLSSLNPFIGDYSNQLNIRLDVTNEQVTYFIPFEDQRAEIKTNLKVSYGLVFSYRFLSVRIGARPKLSDSDLKNRGETDHFRLRVKLLFDKWTHRLEYNYTRGFYIDNTEDIQRSLVNPDFKYQFPHLTTNIVSGSSQYKFNDNYSVKAIESNTEIQLQSAGTFMAGIDYALYFVRGTDYIKTEDQSLVERDTYNEFSGFAPIINAGYHYTYVFHRFWYANAFVNPGIGLDFNSTNYYNNNVSTTSNSTDLLMIFRTGISAGYNGEKIYFGGEFGYDTNSDKFTSNKITLQPIKHSFHLFFGYRFKPPKQVRRPVEYLEKKVPILHQ